MHDELAWNGDDSWIEDDQGEKVFKVDGKALRARHLPDQGPRWKTSSPRSRRRSSSVRDKMKVERDGRTLATVHKALVGIRDRYDIEVEDGPGLKARGNFLQHEDHRVKRDDDVIANVSKKWFRVRDTYGVEVVSGRG